MEIRIARVDDAAAIAAVNASAWKAGFADIAEDGFLDTYDGLPDVRYKDLQEQAPGEIQLVVVDGAEIVGWLSAGPCDDADGDPNTTVDLKACYVDPGSWRGGVGRRLVAELLGRLDGGPWVEMVVWTPAGTPRSIGFYESFGFEQDGAGKTFHRAGIEILRLRMKLSKIAPKG